MHRYNHGPGSGIVLNQCRGHGFWFDPQELDGIPRWICTAGLLVSYNRRQAVRRDNDRLKKLLEPIDEIRRRFTVQVSEVDYWKLRWNSWLR